MVAEDQPDGRAAVPPTGRSWSCNKYPPAEPEALRLLAPQRGLFATVESKSNRNSKSHVIQMARAMLTVMRKGILPELSNFYCHPGKAGGSPFAIEGHIKPAASQHIDEIIRQLNALRQRVPNRVKDIAEVRAVQSPGGDTLSIRADLFLLTRERKELYFEIKTPQPNKDTSMAMKKFILRVAALRDGHPAEAYGATAYNPYGDGKPYAWNYAKQFLDIGNDMLIGRAYWEKIGDDQTYDELLEISDAVGKQITKQVTNI